MAPILDDPSVVGIRLGQLLVEQAATERRQREIAVAILDCQIVLLQQRLGAARRAAISDAAYASVHQALEQGLAKVERARDAADRQRAIGARPSVWARGFRYLAMRGHHTYPA